MSELDDIHETLKEIHETLSTHKSGAGDWVALILITYLFLGWSGSRLDRWTDRVWYSTYYDADWINVDIHKRPHDCDFLHAPLGSKECHYSKQKLVFAADEKRQQMNQVATQEEKQAIANRPNFVVLFWEKKED